MKVLICTPVEDHRNLLKEMLEREGLTVATCATHTQAKCWVENFLPHLILIDPWHDGSIESINQAMNVFWHHQARVAFITNRVNEDELKQLEHPRPDMVINLLPAMSRAALLKRIRLLAQQKPVAR